MQYTDRTLSDTLTLTVIHPDGKRKKKILKFHRIKSQRDPFKETLSMFSHRHAMMRAMQAETEKNTATV